MNLIDHRILIPASPEHVWRFVGDIRRSPEWQVNVANLSMLTQATKPTAGTRFRLTQQRGRDQVWEVTAWYERFGYEYHIVEGSPFRQNKGLVRLQETPEGTIVQWTMEYSGGGLFGGAGKAQEQIIIDSLQKLYKLITRSKEVDTFQAKSLMRDDPGVEARASYRPRHPTSVPTESGEGVRVPKSPYAAPTPAKPIPAVPTDNPFAPPKPLPQASASVPEKLHDTRPRPAVVEPIESSANLEPDFLIDEPSTPFTNIPSEPLRVPSLEPSPVAPPTPVEFKPEAPAFIPPLPVIPPVPPQPAPSPVVEIPALPPIHVAPPVVEIPPVAPMSPSQPVTPEPKALAPAPEATPVSVPVTPEPSKAAEKPTEIPPKPAKDKLGDTSKLSVFEIFGLPKPSQTQPMAPLNMDALSETGRITAVIEDEPVTSSTPETPSLEIPAAPPKIKTIARQLGKRALLRRQLGKVRPRFDI